MMSGRRFGCWIIQTCFFCHFEHDKTFLKLCSSHRNNLNAWNGTASTRAKLWFWFEFELTFLNYFFEDSYIHLDFVFYHHLHILHEANVSLTADLCILAANMRRPCSLVSSTVQGWCSPVWNSQHPGQHHPAAEYKLLNSTIMCPLICCITDHKEPCIWIWLYLVSIFGMEVCMCGASDEVLFCRGGRRVCFVQGFFWTPSVLWLQAISFFTPW